MPFGGMLQPQRGGTLPSTHLDQAPLSLRSLSPHFRLGAHWKQLRLLCFPPAPCTLLSIKQQDSFTSPNFPPSSSPPSAQHQAHSICHQEQLKQAGDARHRLKSSGKDRSVELRGGSQQGTDHAGLPRLHHPPWDLPP